MDDLKELLGKCYLSGSRAFGVNSPDSDWDYLADVPTFEAIEKILIKRGIKVTPHNYEVSVYFQFDDKKINLIRLSAENMLTWMGATECVVALCKTDIWKAKFMQRGFRIHFFEHARTGLR